MTSKVQDLKPITCYFLILFICFLAGCQGTQDRGVMEKGEKDSVVYQYTNLAHATYQDSLFAAINLRLAVSNMLDKPTEDNLKEARKAWINARIPYQQSEVFRFGNSVVDEWEGQLNAWPLDEGLIDYVDLENYDHVLGNAGATANIIANGQINNGTEKVDLSEITAELIASLNEFGGSEANVASGYHAIEFLLWGQDLQGTSYGAGVRPVTDFVVGAGCTNKNCDRRRDYLLASVDLLVEDLREMVRLWEVGGSYRNQLLSEPPRNVYRRMLFGMGSLSLGELAGERMKVALEANSPEDEHDCFSDNTHNSHLYNAKGIENVYLGQYISLDGSRSKGPSLSDLVRKKSPKLDKEIRAALTEAISSIQTLVDYAERPLNPMSFDMMIAEGNFEGRRMIESAINALVIQTRKIEEAALILGIQSLNPETADHSF